MMLGFAGSTQPTLLKLKICVHLRNLRIKPLEFRYQKLWIQLKVNLSANP